MNQALQALHQKALLAAKHFHQSEASLIDILQELDDKKLFIHMGFASLFDYALKALRLSESNASNFIIVARKSKSVPELKAAIKSQAITVSKARKITPVLTPSNSAHWLELAKTLPKEKLEKEVAKVRPQVLTPERAKYVTETRLELKMGVSENLMTKLKRVQDLISQRTKKAASFEEVLEVALTQYLDRNDPVEKARRNNPVEKIWKIDLVEKAWRDDRFEKTQRNYPAKTSNTLPTLNEHQTLLPKEEHVPGHTKTPAQASFFKKRAPLIAAVRHQVQLRDNGQCVYVNSQGERCDNRRWVEIHHRLPVAKGGGNNPENLMTLCHSHHRRVHLN